MDGTTAMSLIADWHRYEIGCPPAQWNARMLAGFPLWGEKYARWFERYGLASLLASENRRALTATGSRFVIYVDDVARRILEPRQGCGLFVLRSLPPMFVELAQRTPQLKYPLMTAVHSILIHEAAQCGAGFSMAVGDLVYSDRYLAQLLRLSERHETLVHLGVSADYARARDALGQGPALPADDLGRIGYGCMQSSWRSWSMENTANFTNMPSCHLIFWRGYDYIRVHCPHMGPVWLGPEKCKAAGVIPVINGGIDAEQHLFGAGFYMPQRSDDMMLITLNTEEPAQPRQSFDGFCRQLAGTLGPHAEHLPCFLTPCMMPAAPSSEPWQSDETIETQWQELRTRLGV